MIYKMRLHPEPFEAIKGGRQQVETRLYDKKRRQIKVGDKITFLKRPEEEEKMIAEVVGLSVFSSFTELFNTLDELKLGYQENATQEEQLAYMRKYYLEEEEKKYGVVGIHLF